MKPKIYSKNFNKPDETRSFQSHGKLEVINFDDGSVVGKGVFEPGWKWSNDIKPIAGTHSCQASHTGYCISGAMVIRMDNGETFRIKEGDAFQIPPGHDAWVEGSEPCTLLDITGFVNYAKKAA